jgi:hypothetical protein
MSEIIFFIKVSLLTMALIFIMQIEVGGRTLETYAQRFVYTSPVVAPLHTVAKGAAKMSHDLKEKVAHEFHERFKK